MNKPPGGVHLVADGMRIEPDVSGLVLRFYVPSRYRNLELRSRSARPCDVFDSSDQRELGICLAGLTLIDRKGSETPIAIDGPLLRSGVYDLEEGYRRWTNGRVLLAADLMHAPRDGFFLRVELASFPFC